MRLTRRYRFAAAHRLHTPQLSDEQNRELYGKCNNPFGHGHDYVMDVTVRGQVNEETGLMLNLPDLDELVDAQVLRFFHHRNMNTDVPAFSETVPTTENVAVEIRDRLARHWGQAFPARSPQLEKIRLYETRKNIIELSGDGQ